MKIKIILSQKELLKDYKDYILHQKDVAGTSFLDEDGKKQKLIQVATVEKALKDREYLKTFKELIHNELDFKTTISVEVVH